MFILGPEVTEKKEVADLVRGFEDGFNAMLARKEKEQAAVASLSDSSKNAPDHFLGADMCIRCHVAEGEQWKTTHHSRAWATLTERHKDATPECVPCHVVGYKQPGGFGMNTTGAVMSNVQCENCHGMGTKHEAFAASSQKLTEATCMACHTTSTSPDFNFAKFKPYIDHTHKESELPPLSSRTPMK
jgi:hypothetical protein